MKPHHQGFTRIDLLATVLILTMLALLFLPSLAPASIAAVGTSCVDNQRQVCLAWQQYAADHSDRPCPWKTPQKDSPNKFTSASKPPTSPLTASAKSKPSSTAYPGKIPLFLCIKMPTGEAVFIETHEKFKVSPTREFATEADRLFGEETYYATVDTSLPEPKRKAWEKRPANNGDEE